MPTRAMKRLNDVMPGDSSWQGLGERRSVEVLGLQVSKHASGCDDKVAAISTYVTQKTSHRPCAHARVCACACACCHCLYFVAKETRA